MSDLEKEYIINTIEYLIVHIKGLDEKDRQNQADAIEWINTLRISLKVNK